MPTHTLLTISPNKKASAETIALIREHGPTFRVPIERFTAWRDDRIVIPVCGLRDNWIGLLFEDELQY